MSDVKNFLKIMNNEFDSDRVTFQRSVPTFHPESVEEAARFMGLANAHNQKLFIAGFGNIITPVGDKFRDTVAIKSDRLNSVIQIVPADFYIVVGAGYPLREINLALEKHGLFLPHAGLPYVGSVGGALAAGLSADYHGHNFPLSKYFIKSDIADPTGNVISPGSACFKSVSGLDIVKIFSPSWGLLGMIVTATFRVLPVTEKPQYEKITMNSIEYEKFADLYKNPGDNNSAIYSIKIKNRFDPKNILPLIEP